MKLPFWKITPGGNPTVLLRADDVPVPLRPHVAETVMSPLHLGCEQVGFVRFGGAPSHPEAPSRPILPRLDMMGGEFCLNAARAFALLLAAPPPSQGGRGPEWESLYEADIEVSGSDGPVRVRAENGRAAASLAFAVWPRVESVGEGIVLVRLPGIAHLILEGPPAPSLAETCAALRLRFGLENEDAAGCLWLSGPAHAPELSPAVWVRDTQSLCLESACGSGTLACALALRQRSGENRFFIRQPSGRFLDVAFEEAGSGGRVWVDGEAALVARGVMTIA